MGTHRKIVGSTYSCIMLWQQISRRRLAGFESIGLPSQLSVGAEYDLTVLLKAAPEVVAFAVYFLSGLGRLAESLRFHSRHASELALPRLDDIGFQRCQLLAHGGAWA